MRFAMIAALTAGTLALPAMAQDVATGEKEYRKCKACHMIQSPEGEDIVKGGRTGPNLHGVVGRAAGSQEDFKYSDALMALNAAGEVWTVEDLAAYMTDPNKFVQDKTGDPKARTKMTFKLNKNQEDIAAYLATFSEEGSADGEDSSEEASEEAEAS